MKLIKIHIILLLVLVANVAQSSEPRKAYFDKTIEHKHFDKELWKETIKDIDYTIKKKKKKRRENNNTARPPANRDNPPFFDFDGAFLKTFMKILLIAAIIIVTVFVLINLLGIESIFSPRSRKINPTDGTINIETIEQNIHESDLDRFIREAVEQQNYPLAIRLYYLAILKELSLSKKIKWKKDKTNRNYLREMRSSPLFNDFRDATGIFERIWYGNKAFGKEDYLHIKPKFEALVSSAQQVTAS